MAYANVSYEVLHREDGSILMSTREGAERACTERGAHLATVREFAQIARERGAFGPKDARVPGQLAREIGPGDRQGLHSEAYINSVGGYDPIIERGEDGRDVIAFYYNRQNFKCWAGDLDHDFWTASDVGPGRTYLFLGREASLPGALYLADVDAQTEHAVLCVR